MFITPTFAQNAQPSNVKSATANITFDETEIDYGTIAKGSDPVRTFKFINTGRTPLIIKDVQTTSGCVVATYSKEPILSEQTATVIVRYDTSQVGVFSKIVTVVTNVNSIHILNLIGTVIE